MTQSDSFEFSLLGFERRLAAIEQAGGSRRLAGGMIGLEKESLRVAADGTLSQRRHPAALGSPLVHPWITTDFSEALLEFITPPFTDGEHAVEFMADLQAYVYAHLDDEILWATSISITRCRKDCGRCCRTSPAMQVSGVISPIPATWG